MPVTPTSALVAEVEYYNQLILDHFARLDALATRPSGGNKHTTTAVISIDEDDMSDKRAKIGKRIKKAVDQLLTECEKLAITGVTAETIVSAEARKGRFGIPSPNSDATKRPVTSSSAATSPNAAIVANDDPALQRAQRWRWVAYCHDIDAQFAGKYDGQRPSTSEGYPNTSESVWDGSLVAATLRSRAHALLMELIPLERVLDNGLIRRGTTTTAETSVAADDPIVKILTANVRDALEQLRSTCRDAITIKETAAVAARLKASAAASQTPVTTTQQSGLTFSAGGSSSLSSSTGGGGRLTASPTSHYHGLHQSTALSPFELFIVQYFAAEAVRIATQYGMTMAGGNSCSGVSLSLSAAERTRRTSFNRSHPDHQISAVTHLSPQSTVSGDPRTPATVAVSPDFDELARNSAHPSNDAVHDEPRLLSEGNVSVTYTDTFACVSPPTPSRGASGEAEGDFVLDSPQMESGKKKAACSVM